LNARSLAEADRALILDGTAVRVPRTALVVRESSDGQEREQESEDSPNVDGIKYN